MSNVCLMCFVTFDNENDLRNHQCKSEPEQLLCDVNPISFLDVNEIKKHISSHSDRKHSDKSNKKSGSLKKSNKHSRIKPNKCHLKVDYIIRRKYRYIKNVRKIIQNDTTPFEFFCNACSRGYNFESSWQKHLRLHHTVAGHRCKYCKKIFISYLILKFHKRNHAEEMRFPCDLCQKVFISKARLQAHRSMHLNREVYPCEICEKTFSRKEYLKRHLEIHQNGKYRGKDRSCTCTICGKVLATESSLKNHYAMHTGERNFACEEPGCDKKFKTESNLDNHRKLVHLGIRNHHCFHCNVSYVRPGDLRLHFKTMKHQNRVKEVEESSSQSLENEFVNIPNQLPWVGLRDGKKRKHRCEDCNSSFLKLAHLKKHLLSLVHKIKVGEVAPGHKDKPFRCEDCSLSFACNFHLERHLKSQRHFKIVEELKLAEESGTLSETILAQREHCCNICNMTFTDARRLKLHCESKRHKNKLVELETGVKNTYTERRHSCNDCNMMFFNTHHLTRHLGTLRHKKRVEELIASGMYIKEEPVDPEEILPN